MRATLTLFSYGEITGPTHDSILDEITCPNDIEWSVDRSFGDALISRSRSVAISRFFSETDADVLLMVDRDIAWRPGDAAAICKKTFLLAQETPIALAGLYAQRAMAAGFTSRLTDLGAAKAARNLKVGSDQLFEAEYLAGGFLCISRQAVTTMIDKLDKLEAGEARIRQCVRDVVDGKPKLFWDFARPMIVPSRLLPEQLEYLSEDWSISARISAAGGSCLVWAFPSLTHHGSHGFTFDNAKRG